MLLSNFNYQIIGEYQQILIVFRIRHVDSNEVLIAFDLS